MEKKSTLVVVSVLLGFVLMCGLAFWLGQQQEKGIAKQSSEPVKRFRAKPGTERKNARALTSSIPSPEKNRSTKPVKEWGSLDKPEEGPKQSAEEKVLREIMMSASPEEAIQQLLERMAFTDEGDVSPTEQAILAYMYSRLDPPDMERADELFSTAWESDTSKQSQVEVVYFISKAALEQGRYEDVFTNLNRLGTGGLPASGYALELGIMAGIAYEGLGDKDGARKAYEHAMNQARTIGLDTNYQVGNAYRAAGLRLGMLHRSAGDDRQAPALGKRVNLALNP